MSDPKSFGGALARMPVAQFTPANIKPPRFHQKKVAFNVGPVGAHGLQPGDIVCMTFPNGPKEHYKLCMVDSNGDIQAIQVDDDSSDLRYPDCLGDDSCEICDPWAIDIMQRLCDDEEHIKRCCPTLMWRGSFPTDLSDIISMVGGMK